MNVRRFVLLPLLAIGCEGVGLNPYTDYVPNGDPGLPGGTGADTDGDTDPGGGVGTDTTESDSDGPVDTDPVPAGAPLFTSIVPDYGTNAGGTEVTLTGENLDRGLQIEFGGVAGTVISTDGTSAVVETPAVSVAGKVTVKLSGRGGSTNTPDAYRYWADASGKVGGLFILDKTRFRGGYWTNPNLSWAALYGGFVQPTNFSFWQVFTPTQGTCANNYTGSPRITYRDPGATKLTMTGNSVTVDMPESTTTQGYFGSADLALTDAPTTRSWTLDAVVGPAWWPGFEVPDLVRGLDNFELTSPAIANTNAPNVNRGFDLVWTGSGGDYMVAVLTHYTQIGGALSVVQEVTCSMPDNGRFTVASNVWTSWRQRTTDYIEIQLGRIKVRSAVLPMDQSTVSGVSEAWVIGAADMN